MYDPGRRSFYLNFRYPVPFLSTSILDILRIPSSSVYGGVGWICSMRCKGFRYNSLSRPCLWRFALALYVASSAGLPDNLRVWVPYYQRAAHARGEPPRLLDHWEGSRKLAEGPLLCQQENKAIFLLSSFLSQTSACGAFIQNLYMPGRELTFLPYRAQRYVVVLRMVFVQHGGILWRSISSVVDVCLTRGAEGICDPRRRSTFVNIFAEEMSMFLSIRRSVVYVDDMLPLVSSSECQTKHIVT